MTNALVTSACGIAGVNFRRALRLDKKIKIFGTEMNYYHKVFQNNDPVFLVHSPKNHKYLNEINKIIKDNNIDFLHPQSSPELQVITMNKNRIKATTFLPSKEIVLKDKFSQQELLRQNDIPVAKTLPLKSINEIELIKNKPTFPVWVRARKGVGGRLSIKCNSKEEIFHWVKLCQLQKRASVNEFLIQKFLSGRDIAWDSLWYNGELIVSYARQRLEYPFSKLTMSGITGTPTVAKIIHDKQVNDIAYNAVKVLAKKPHGCFSVDLKEDDKGLPHITEVDAGKFHTTIGLWSYSAEKILKLPWLYNLPRLYVHIGMGRETPIQNKFNIYPKNMYMIRNLDCGAWIKLSNFEEQII